MEELLSNLKEEIDLYWHHRIGDIHSELQQKKSNILKQLDSLLESFLDDDEKLNIINTTELIKKLDKVNDRQKEKLQELKEKIAKERILLSSVFVSEYKKAFDMLPDVTYNGDLIINMPTKLSFQKRSNKKEAPFDKVELQIVHESSEYYLKMQLRSVWSFVSEIKSGYFNTAEEAINNGMPQIIKALRNMGHPTYGEMAVEDILE